jgi:large subunit ribosomal protein L24
VSKDNSGRPHLKKGDVVTAVTGADAVEGKTGKILQVFPQEGRALVEGFNFVKKHLRKSQDNPKGGIIEKEAPIHLSNLRLAGEPAKKAAAGPKRSGKA